MNNFGTDSRSIQPAKGTAAEVIIRKRDAIISRWLSKINEELQVARKEMKPILVNTVPPFLVNLAQALDKDNARQLATESSSVAQEHGGERARLTNFGPEDILREYQLLRETVFSVLKTEVEISEEERSIILLSFDQAVTEAMSSYFLVMTNLRERYAMFMSHEIRKPLSSIYGKALLLKRHPQEQERIKEIADEIFENLQNINSIIEELLDPHAKENPEKLRLPLEKGNLRSIVESALHGLNLRYGETFLLEAEDVLGYWHAASIKRAIESLGANSVTYGRDGRINVKVVKTHGRAIISVHNPQKYVPSEKQEFLFQSFRRRENVTSDPRTWKPGLPLVRGVAEAHGGSVSVDSSPEKGTAFMMDLLIDSRPYQNSEITPGAEDPRSQAS